MLDPLRGRAALARHADVYDVLHGSEGHVVPARAVRHEFFRFVETFAGFVNFLVGVVVDLVARIEGQIVVVVNVGLSRFAVAAVTVLYEFLRGFL